MDLQVIRQFIKKVQELDTLFQEMQTLKQQEVGLKLLTSLLKRNETRLGGRFKMKTVIWYSMKDFEKFFDICFNILFTSEDGVPYITWQNGTSQITSDKVSNVKEKFDECLCQFSLSDYDIVRNMEQIVRKLAHQLDAIETTLDYNEENSVLVSENDSNDHIMGIDMNTDLQENTNETKQYEFGIRNEDTNNTGNTDVQEFNNETMQYKLGNNTEEIIDNFTTDLQECTNKPIEYELEDTIEDISELIKEGPMFYRGTESHVDNSNSVQSSKASHVKNSKCYNSDTECLGNNNFSLLHHTNNTLTRNGNHGYVGQVFNTNDASCSNTVNGTEITLEKTRNPPSLCFKTEHLDEKEATSENDICQHTVITKSVHRATKCTDNIPVSDERYSDEDKANSIASDTCKQGVHGLYSCEDIGNGNCDRSDEESSLKTEAIDEERVEAENHLGAFVPVIGEGTKHDTVLNSLEESHNLLSNKSNGRTNNSKKQLSNRNNYFNRAPKKTLKTDPKFTEIKGKNNIRVLKTTQLNKIQISKKNHIKDAKIGPKASNVFHNETLTCDKNKERKTRPKGSSAYKCKVCDKLFCRQKLLYKHYRKHKGGEFCCLTCGVFHQNSSQLSDHMDQHEKDNKLKCPLCGEVFDKTRQYKAHLASHRSYPCTLCEKSLPTQGSLARHKNLTHGIKDETDFPAMLLFSHQCELCGARFTKELTYLVHKAKHTGEKPYKCEVCCQFFTNHQCFLKHNMTLSHNMKIGKVGGERKFLCQQCGKSFLRKDALKRHERHHTGERSHMCQFCGFKSKEANNLKTHIALHFESQRNFICEMCGAAFHKKKTLEVHHQFKHSDERNYPCTHCDMTFKAKSSLVRHMKVHSQDKNHACWCGSAFKTLYNLRRHMNTLHAGNNKLPPAKHVQTLDCPVKNIVSKTDFHFSNYDEQAVAIVGDNLQQPEEGNEDIEKDGVHDISMEGDISVTSNLPNTNGESVIPTISTFRHSETLPADGYNMEDLQHFSEQKEVGLNESGIITEEVRDESRDSYGRSVRLLPNQNSNHGTFDNESLLTTNTTGDGTYPTLQLLTTQNTENVAYWNESLLSTNNSDHGKTNLPQFSLYGYPPPYNSVLPQFMYVQPRYEPTIPSPASYATYEQLIRLGSLLPSQAVQQVTGMNPNLNVPLSRMTDTDGYGPTPPGLSLDQLRILHHEIHSRMSQEEISQRLNSEVHRQSLLQMNNTDQKSNDIPSTIVFDYNEKRDCSYVQPAGNDCSFDQSADEELIAGRIDEKQNEEMYDSSMDVDYLQKRDCSFDNQALNDCSFEDTADEKVVVTGISKQNGEASHDDIYDRSIAADYLQKKEASYDNTALNDCSFEQQVEEKVHVIVAGATNKENVETSHEDMYDSSIDADYLQSRREMAAESLALMSALTPEPVYNVQEINNQML